MEDERRKEKRKMEDIIPQELLKPNFDTFITLNNLLSTRPREFQFSLALHFNPSAIQ